MPVLDSQINVRLKEYEIEERFSPLIAPAAIPKLIYVPVFIEKGTILSPLPYHTKKKKKEKKKATLYASPCIHIS